MNARTPFSRSCEEHTFDSFDQTPLFYRYWPAVEAGAKKAIVLFHRGHEHGGRMAHVVDELGMPDAAFFAWDARGLGQSPGERGYAESFGTLVKDVDAFVRHIAREYGYDMSDIAVIAQSVGAVIVSTWVHDYAPAIRGMVLASPAFKVKLYVPFARQGLALMQKFRKKFFVNSYVKARFLTHDEDRIASYDSDPLITRPIAVNILLGLYEAAERVIADAATINTPTQLLISGADWVVHRKPQEVFLDRLGSKVKELHVLEGFYHDTLGEKERGRALEKARAFLSKLYATEPARISLLDADRHGVTRDEFDRLSKPPASLAARVYWAMSRFWIQVGGQLSAGLNLGIRTGFDSGSTLDYVYRNDPGGLTPFGRLIDRIYLNSIGWRGIRIRKIHLEQMIRQAMERLLAAERPVRIVDIAAGHGRYVLEALERHRDRVEHIALRDYSTINVDAGRKLIAEKRLGTVARFDQGDAFDRAALASLTPRPTLTVVSGLYELFPDNGMIRNSLAGLAEAIEEGGYLIYTGQPWHPQLELIARSLTSHRDGRAWVMRRRTQEELDHLVEAAGFEKLDQLTDEWGIFTVSLCRKLPSP